MRAARQHWRRPSGLTLVEVLVTMSIILVLASAVLFGSRAINASRKRGIAERQMALISTAIDQYAAFWPRWEVGGALIADEGWPDFIPGRLFALCSMDCGGRPCGPYEQIGGFNDFVDVGIDWLNLPDPDDPQYPTRFALLLNGNTSLAFALTAGSGKGPIIRESIGVNLVSGADLISGATQILLPGFDGSCVAAAGGAKRAEIFVDPWGTPLRYFWVYRDAGRTSFRGYLPVSYGAFTTGNGFGGVDNNFFITQQNFAAPQIAAGYVLESAGPDRKFGNVWKVMQNPPNAADAIDIADADDNITIAP